MGLNFYVKEFNMYPSNFTQALLLGSTLLISACSPLDNSSQTAKVTPIKKQAAKTMQYITPGQTDADHLYLEEVLGDKALEEVKAWNNKTLARLTADPMFKTMEAEALSILQSKDKIPYVSYRGGVVHNFWQDAQHVRGIWRTSSLESYLTESPKWKTVLDIDALSKAEDRNWVYKGMTCLSPKYERCIINLSDGGKDAVVRREFNTSTQSFIENGFITEESKGGMSWLSEDAMVVGVDFGEGSMTDSGYPMVAKLWERGTPLSSAVEFARGEQADVGYWAGVWELSNGSREIVATRAITFYDSETYWFPRYADGSIAQTVKFPVPLKSSVSGEFKGQVIVKLAQDWREFKSGALVSFGMEDFMADGEIEKLNLVFSPDEKSSIENFGSTRSKLLVSIYSDVTGAAYEFDWNGEQWNSKKLDFPTNGSVSIGSTNDKEDVAFISTESFLIPDTLYTYNTQTGKKAIAKTLPNWFDAESMSSEQFFATSTDGTQVPYFVVRKKDLKLDGSNPTLLYGYGGFEVSLNPSYSATRGKLWIERGGVFVLANIRGGGEYGPSWHQAGLKTLRQNIYDDFIAVAEDLIATNITSAKHLGIEGGSNGGLLMGVMFTQRPDLFNAVVCAVPLLDMLRYHKLLAGASWMGEYGNPEDETEGEFLRKMSPYHNVDPQADYPEVFFITSTKDDRVHPAHARKVAKRMEDQGHAFLYYENIDGGHSAAANLKETAKRLALQHVYLLQKLQDGK
jgi:prolyl oligopeptidase